VGALAGVAAALAPRVVFAAGATGCTGTPAPPAASADGAVHLSLDPCGLPGGGSLQTLINGLGFDALLAALAVLVVGMVMWGGGTRWGNNNSAHTGKLMTLGAGLASMGIGAAPTIINFFYKSGLGWH
jgi:hypothetical protein